MTTNESQAINAIIDALTERADKFDQYADKLEHQARDTRACIERARELREPLAHLAAHREQLESSLACARSRAVEARAALYLAEKGARVHGFGV